MTITNNIYTDEKRALSEYISYYDDPNDSDDNLPTSVKVRTTGATTLGIEVDGLVTNLDSAVEQSFAIVHSMISLLSVMEMHRPLMPNP